MNSVIKRRHQYRLLLKQIIKSDDILEYAAVGIVFQSGYGNERHMNVI